MNKQVLDWNKIQTIDDLKAITAFLVLGKSGVFTPKLDQVKVRDKRSFEQKKADIEHLMVEK